MAQMFDSAAGAFYGHQHGQAQTRSSAIHTVPFGYVQEVQQQSQQPKAYHQPLYSFNNNQFNDHESPFSYGAVGQPLVSQPPINNFDTAADPNSAYHSTWNPIPQQSFEVWQVIYEIHKNLLVTRNYHAKSGHVMGREPIGVYEYFASDHSYLFVNIEVDPPSTCVKPTSCSDSSSAHRSCRVIASKAMIRYHSHRSHTPDPSRLLEVIFKPDAHAAQLNSRLLHLLKQSPGALSQHQAMSRATDFTAGMPVAKKPCLGSHKCAFSN